MIDRRTSLPDSVFAERYHEPSSDRSLVVVPPVNIQQLTGRDINIGRPDIGKAARMHTELTRKPVSLFLDRSESGILKFGMIGPKLSGRQVNALLYAVAQDKSQGFATDDIVNDAKDIYDPAEAALLHAHEQMLGWELSAGSRARITKLLDHSWVECGWGNITMTAEARERYESDGLIPLLRWTKDAEGNRTILLDPVDDTVRSRFTSILQMRGDDPMQLDNGMGLIFLGANSPAQPHWPKKDGLRGEDDAVLKSSLQLRCYIILLAK